jgi:hypothetical protein
MIATVDDVSEPMSIKELRVAAAALARTGGSATITTGIAADAEARSIAREALEILADAGVQASLED